MMGNVGRKHSVSETGSKVKISQVFFSASTHHQTVLGFSVSIKSIRKSWNTKEEDVKN